MSTTTKEDVDELLLAFGQRIKAARHKQGMTLRNVSRDCGRSVGFLCDMENGRREPSAATLERLADVFGTTMDALWRGVERDGERAINAGVASREAFILDNIVERIRDVAKSLREQGGDS